MNKKAAQIAVTTYLCVSLLTGTVVSAHSEEELPPDPPSVVVEAIQQEQPEPKQEVPAPVEPKQEVPASVEEKEEESTPVEQPAETSAPAPAEQPQEEPASAPEDHNSDAPTPAPAPEAIGGDASTSDPTPDGPAGQEPASELDPELDHELPPDEGLLAEEEPPTENPAVAKARDYARKSLKKRVNAIADRLGMTDGYQLSQGEDNFADALAIYAIWRDQTENYPYEVEIATERDFDELQSIYWSLNRVNAAKTDAGSMIRVKRIPVSKRYGLSGSEFQRLSSGKCIALVESLT